MPYLWTHTDAQPRMIGGQLSSGDRHRRHVERGPGGPVLASFGRVRGQVMSKRNDTHADEMGKARRGKSLTLHGSVRNQQSHNEVQTCVSPHGPRKVMKHPYLAVVSIILLTTTVGLASCASQAAVQRPTQQSTTSVSVAGTTTPIPAGKPVEIRRFEQGQELWQTWIEGDTVVWMQSAGAAAKTGLAYSASSSWDTVFGVASVDGGDAQEIAGVRLLAPNIPNAFPYSLTLPLAWAEVLPRAANAPLKLVWAAPPETLAETYLFHGVYSWTPGGAPLELLPGSSVSLRAQAAGDALAIPIPIASFSEAGDDADDPANWEKLLMMTANMSAPAVVDPKAPKLPDSALAGLSPYFSLLTREHSTPRVSVFDLRTGEKLALDLPTSYPYAIVAGHCAAWWTQDGDVFLADLDTRNTQKVLSLGTDQDSPLAVALGKEWLVALKPWASFSTEAAMANPSQHPGADLIALRLPDLRRVDIAGVIPKGEVGSVQVSGNTVLLTVSPATEPMPHNEPNWVALQAVRLK